MIEAIELTPRYADGLQKSGFVADRKTQQAVILNVTVIGEAATKIAGEYPDFAAQHAAGP